jgi:hypothetical protein
MKELADDAAFEGRLLYWQRTEAHRRENDDDDGDSDDKHRVPI